MRGLNKGERIRDRIVLAALAAVLVLPAVLWLFSGPPPVEAQSRTNRLTRPCAGSATPSQVSIAKNGDILLQPCAAGKVTIQNTAGDIQLIIDDFGDPSLLVDGSFLIDTYSSLNVGGEVYIGRPSSQGTAGKITLYRTVTAAGTTGNQTINKIAGTVNFAAGASAITVTNSLAAANSFIFTNVRTADATCTFVKSAVPGSGSFVITLNAACTAETSVAFLVTN